MTYIIYQTAFIGDIILSTSIVRTIRENCADSKIIFITTPAGKNLLQNNPSIDEIIVYDKRSADKGIAGIIRITRRLREIIKSEESVYISPHRFIRASVIGFLSGSPVRVGFTDSTLSFLYNHTVNYEYGIHEIERNFRLLQKVPGINIENVFAANPELFPSHDDFTKVKEILGDAFHAGETVISIAPGSVWKTKRWPEESYVKLVELLQQEGVKIALIGGVEDRGLCDRICRDDCLNLAGELSFLESTALIGLTKAIVTNDSAPLHIASAMNVPAIAIFGATTSDFGFGPLSENSVILERRDLECRPCGRHGGMECRKGHFECMNKILPETVFVEVLKIMKPSSR